MCLVSLDNYGIFKIHYFFIIEAVLNSYGVEYQQK